MPVTGPQFGNVPASFLPPPEAQPPMAAPAPLPVPAPAPMPTGPPVPAQMMPAFSSPPASAPPGKPGWSQILTMLPLLIGGIKDPVVMGAALAGFQQGQDKKRELALGAEAHQRELQNDRARFYSDAITHAQQFDDGVALQQYLQAIKPMADYYGVSLAGLTLSDEKKATTDRREATAIIEQLRKVHGDVVDDPAWQQAHSATYKDQPQKITAIYAAAQLPVVRDASGAAVAPVPKPNSLTPNTPEEQFYARFASEHGAASYGALSTALQSDARKAWTQLGGGNGRGTSEEQFYQQYATEKGYKDFASMPTAQQTAARKQWSAADDRPTANTGNSSDIKESIAGMKDGTLPPQLPGRASKDYTAIMAEAHRQGYDLAAAVTDWNATQRHILTMNNGQQLRLNQSINALPELLDSVGALADKWNGGRFPILNRANLALAKGGAYGPDVATVANQLSTQIADVVSDLGNVYMGGNSPTDHALELAKTSLSADWDAAVLKGMVKLAKQNVVIRRNSILTTGVAGASANNPYAPATGERSGGANPFRLNNGQ